jgi:cell division septation protein DedD
MALDQIHRFGHRRLRFGTPMRRRRMRVWIVVGLFLGFVALAWAWAFQRGPGVSGSGVPLLVADAQSTREKPTDPGGMKVADIDPLSYDSGRAPPQVENILPGPEKPLPQPSPQPTTVAASPPAASDATPADAGAAPAKPTQVADDVPVGPPMKLVTDPAAAMPSPVAAAAPVAKPQPKAKPVAVRDAPKPPAKSMAVEPGGYRLQLASLRSAADAREVEAKLRRTYGDVLGSASFSVVSVNLGDRGTYYRVMAGPMSQGSAAQLCDALRQRGAACILARP